MPKPEEVTLMLRAKNVMTADVVTTASKQTLDDAYRLMRAFAIRHLPVVDDGALVGMLSEGDVLIHAELAEGQVEIPDLQVKDAMTTNVISCFPQSTLSDVASTMVKFKIDSLPVVEDGKLVGILTTTDLLDIFCRRRAATRVAATERKREAAAGGDVS